MSLDFEPDPSWRAAWKLRPGVTYLNHGSFGPPPEPVRAARRAWLDEIDAEPMDFFARKLRPAWSAARRRLAEFVGADEANLVFVENATQAMNVVARSTRLRPGDEALLTDHEYGAVARLWRKACEEAGATLRVVELPLPLADPAETARAVADALSPRTRLVVASHVTSPTAAVLPVAAICRAARQVGAATCVDGPHALAQLPLALDALDCDFYTASCHKWLSAPFGSGFLYVHPRRHAEVRPHVLSWGGWPLDPPRRWDDEFPWLGTRDCAPLLAVPAALDFLEQVGWERFRRHTRAMARFARRTLLERVGMPPLTPDVPEAKGAVPGPAPHDWNVAMALIPIPPGDRQSLQDALWNRHQIEVPVVEWKGRRFVRVSCHLYTQPEQIELLARALPELLAEEG